MHCLQKYRFIRSSRCCNLFLCINVKLIILAYFTTHHHDAMPALCIFINFYLGDDQKKAKYCLNVHEKVNTFDAKSAKSSSEPMKAANIRDNEKLLKIQRSQSNPTWYDVATAHNFKSFKTFDI